MEQEAVQFYKLDRRKRYGAEGARIKIGETILLCVVLCFFWALTIAFIIINSADLFHDTQITVFACVFTMILLVITALVFRVYYPAFKRIRRARMIVKNNTITDGTVTDVTAERVQRYTSRSMRSYYAVFLRYTFHDVDGLRYGEHFGNYAEIPFCKGQNLMIAFNKTDSVILNKFTLSDGAEEYARAEAEREQVDFSGLKSKPLKVDTSKPIGIADYSWSMLLKIIKRENRLKRILSSSPSFTVGRMFVKKTTYRRKNGNRHFYCYIDGNGGKHVEECAGICGVNDGDDVAIAYSDTESEIITNYSLMKR